MPCEVPHFLILSLVDTGRLQRNLSTGRMVSVRLSVGPFRTLRLPVVRYLVSPPVWTYGLGRTAHRAWSSVASADAPLTHELATAFAFGGHRLTLFRLVKGELDDARTQQVVVGTWGLLVVQQQNRKQHQAQAWEQPGIPVCPFVSYLRSPARSHATLSPSPISLR